jgi:hypothetical protein
MEYFLVVFLLVLVFLLTYFRRSPYIPNESFLDTPVLKQNLYWFVDSEPNTRNWWDFHGRRSDTPNRGYLEVVLDSLKRTQGHDFNIVPLIGRLQTMAYLETAEPRAIDLPPSLWRVYVISFLASKKGGLIIDGNSVLTLGPSFAPLLVNVQAALFGTDHDEAVVSPKALAPGPDNYIGYSLAPNHPAWTFTLNEYTKLVKSGPQSWTAAVARRMPRTLWETQKIKGMECIRKADGSRLPDGTLRQLEDYFGRSATIEDPNQAMNSNALYVAYDGDALEKRFEYNWFLRLNKKQLEDTNLMWSKYVGLF